MCNLIKIEFYPDYMDKIISFHFINDDELKLLNSIKDNKDFLIEKFYRVTKSNYRTRVSQVLVKYIWKFYRFIGFN